MAKHRNVTVVLDNGAGVLASAAFRVEGHEEDGNDIGLTEIAAAVSRIDNNWLIRDGDTITVKINEHE